MGAPDYVAMQPRRSSYQLIIGDVFRSVDVTKIVSPRHVSRRQQLLLSSAISMAGHGDINALRALNDDEKFDLNCTNRRGWRLIHVAGEAGHLHLVLWLMQSGVDGEAKDNRGWTALMLAAARNRAAVVQALLVHGIDRSLQLAIRAAAANNAIDALHALLSRVRPNQPPRVCQSRICPLRLAANNNHPAALESLILSGYNPACIMNKLQRAPLLREVVRNAIAARKVIDRGTTGVVVSALSDEQSAMRVKLCFDWTGVQVRHRRKRTCMMRKRKSPVIYSASYDETIRMMGHDAIAVNLLTIKINLDKKMRGDHVARALRHLQLTLSESFPVIEQTRMLSDDIDLQLHDLVSRQKRNQLQLFSLIENTSEADIDAALPEIDPLIHERFTIRGAIQELHDRCKKTANAADDVAVVLELKQRIADVTSGFNVESGSKASRLQRELHCLYRARNDLDQISSTIQSQIGVSAPTTLNIVSAAVDVPVSVHTPSAVHAAAGAGASDGQELCFRCGLNPASVSLDTCRHVGLCVSCGATRRLRGATRCTTCHSQVDAIVRDL